MEENTADYGYPFTLAFCTAIEKYIEDRENHDPQIFVYNGANLKYALSRAFYTSLSMNSRLRSLFNAQAQGTPLKKFIARDAVERDFATYLTNIPFEIILEKPTSDWKKALRPFVRSLLLLLGIPKVTRLARTLHNQATLRKMRPQILLCVDSERFARYLEPIARKLDTSYAFFTSDLGAARYLRTSNKPHILVSRFGLRLDRLARKESELERFGIIQKYDLLADTIGRIRPTSTVVVEGNAAHDEIVNQICRQNNIKSVCVQQGWSPIVHTGFRNMSYSKMLMWGDGFSKILAPYNPAQYFVTTGSHIISLRETSQAPTKPFTITFFLQGISHLLPQKAWDEMIILIEKTIEYLPRLSVIIREHPTYHIREEVRKKLIAMGARFLSPPEHSLEAVYKETSVSVSIFSTTLLESIATNIIPIMFNVTSFPNYLPDFVAQGVGIEVRAIEDALSSFQELAGKPSGLDEFQEPMRKFRQEYFTQGKEEAIRAIVKEIENP